MLLLEVPGGESNVSSAYSSDIDVLGVLWATSDAMLSSTTSSVTFEAVLMSSITDDSLPDDFSLLMFDLVEDVNDATEFFWLLIVDSDDSEASKGRRRYREIATFLRTCDSNFQLQFNMKESHKDTIFTGKPKAFRAVPKTCA